MELMNATQLLRRHYVDPIARQQTSIGVEIELPLVSVHNKPIEISFIRKLAKSIQSMGFVATRSTLDGDVCEWVNGEGDVCSFETTWNTLEFSMKNAGALTTVAGRFYPMLIRLQAFCMDNGYYLCGRGINPNYANINIAPLNTPILLAKSQFLTQYTNHHDGEIFHSLCASVQTHLDALTPVQYIERFNLLRRAYVFEGLFFANSPSPEAGFLQNRPALREINTDTLCFRDELWRQCGAPNTQTTMGEITDVEHFCSYFAQMKLFILPDGDGFRPTTPIPLVDYFTNKNCDETALRCFRSLEPIAPTQKGSIEVRSTCTQSLDTLFAPPAFYLGLVECLSESRSKVEDIYNRYFPKNTPAEVRDKLMKKSNELLRRQLQDDGSRLVQIAIDGLRRRGFGEEQFLLPLCNQLKGDFSQSSASHLGANPVLEMQQQMHNVRGIE